MTLIIEDGSMPAGANSYVSVADCGLWQGARGGGGWAAADEAAREAALILAMDYLNGLRWKGRRAACGRLPAWPRLGVTDADGYAIPADAVPAAVVSAQCYLAGVAVSGGDLQPVLERGGAVRREKVGSLETEYCQGAPARELFTVLSDLLRGLAWGLEGASAGHAGVVELVQA